VPYHTSQDSGEDHLHECHCGHIFTTCITAIKEVEIVGEERLMTFCVTLASINSTYSGKN
jgi:hypothetical protein